MIEGVHPDIRTNVPGRKRKNPGDLRIDLHVHTRRSPDGAHSLRSVVKYAKKIGLDGIAITDHNTILPPGMAHDLSREFGIIVIPGVEGGGMVRGKHWIGLNIDEIPKTTEITRIITYIRDHGGLSIAPHPFTRNGYSDYARLGFDAVEGLNGTTPRSNDLFPNESQIPVVAGSDAHAIPMLGYTWTWVNAEKTLEDILDAIRNGCCGPEGDLVPFIQRHLRFYAGLTIRHLLTTPGNTVTICKHICSFSTRKWQDLS